MDLVHTDPCGPIGIERYNGDKYFILFFDDYSRMMNIMYLKDKFEAFQKFKWYLAKVEKETRKNVWDHIEDMNSFLMNSTLKEESKDMYQPLVHLRKMI